MSKYPDDMEIAPGFTVAFWKELNLEPDSPQTEDWQKAIEIFDARIRQRFLEPADVLIEHQKDTKKTFGFAILAIDFLVMETLQGFREGELDHKNKSEKLTKNFLKSWRLFTDCSSDAKDPPAQPKKIYQSYRCALYHSGSTDGDLRIGISGPAFDFKDEDCIKINRTVLHEGLKCEFSDFIRDLQNPANSRLRRYFKSKMDHICGIGAKQDQ